MQSKPRQKDKPSLVIGEGGLLSVAFIADDQQTTPARARRLIRDLKLPITRLPGSKRIFVRRDRYHAALLACEIDPAVTPNRSR